MEEEFVEIDVEDSCLYEDDEIDVNYEFDAPMFFDFSKPESFWDTSEAEQWFEYANSYPPSPFIMKLRSEKEGAMQNVNVDGDNNVSCLEHEQVSTIEDNNSREIEYQNTLLDGKTKSLSKSSSSKSKVFTFMKPTASHLAKLKNPPLVQTSRRFKENSSLSMDCSLTKRQKLEAGYLSKVARLKHQSSFPHKKTKEDDRTVVNLASKRNVTVPREPNLQTAFRAQRHKSRTNTESSEQTKSSSQTTKERPLTKKGGSTLNGNSISSKETTRTNTNIDSRRDKSKILSKLQGNPDDKQVSSKGQRGVFRNIKVFPLEPNDKKVLNEPPTELLSKLTLSSKAKQTTKLLSKEPPISKGLKENRPRTFLKEHERIKFIKEEIQRLYAKQNQCADEMGSLVTKQTCMPELGH